MNYTQGSAPRDDPIRQGGHSAAPITPPCGGPPNFVHGQQYPQTRELQPPPVPPAPPVRQGNAALPSATDHSELPFVEKLLVRGTRGELIREPWFKTIREQHPDEFVFGSTIVVALFSTLMTGVFSAGTVGTIIWHVLFASLWLGWGYLLTALGTKRAHQFVQWVVCVGGAAGGLLGAWISFTGLEFLHRVDRFAESLGVPPAPTGLLVADMVLSLAVAALFGYLGLLVYRGLRRLATVR